MGSCRLPRDLQPHYLIKSLMEWYLIIIFSDYSKLAGKVSKKHVYIFCVTRCSCFSQLSLLVVLCLFYFSVFLSLLEYVKLDNSFPYLVLVEVCMFLIIFILIILSMFLCIMYFCRIYRKRIDRAGFLSNNSSLL